MGYRIAATMGPDGGYRLDAGSELPPLLFDDDQVIALAVALQAATLTGVGIEEDAVRALTTVRQVMPSRLRHRLDPLTFTTISAGSGDADSVSPEVLVAISAAVRAREVFRFDYSNDHFNRQQRNNTPAPSGAASSGDLQASLVPSSRGISRETTGESSAPIASPHAP